MRLDAEDYDVRLADGVQVARDLGFDVKVAFGAPHAEPPFAHRLEMRAAREQHDVSAGARQARADVAADRAGARDDDPHAGFCEKARATTPRWILPVAVRGIASVMWICLGRL